MMNHELKVSNPTDSNPVYTGLATFLAFIVFGSIPLIPFILLGSHDSQYMFYISAIAALCALILLGILKWKIIGTKFIETVFEIVLVGGVAASVAYFVGSLFTI